MKAVVVGAGLGGLATALRLQGLGAEVTVVEQRERPGGRAYQLRDGGFTWDTGPSLLTMPWVLEETFAAGGLDLHSEVTLRRLDPLYRIRWASEDAHLDFSSDPARLRAEVAKFSARDAAQVEPFLAALRPIYERGILGAGRRPFTSRARLRAAGARHGPAGRPAPAALLRRALVRAPARARGVLVPLAVHRRRPVPGARDLRRARLPAGGSTAAGTPRAGPTRWSRRWPRRWTCAAARRSRRSSTPAGASPGVRLAGGERIAADVVVSNADVLRTHELLGRAAPRRRLRETMSCFLLYLGTDRPIRRAAAPHAAGRRRLPRVHPRRHARPRAAAHVLHLRPCAGAHRAGDGAAPAATRSPCSCPVPNLRAGIDWDRDGDRLRDALLADMETSFGLDGIRDAVVVEHRMAPPDFARELGAVWGNAFAVEPTLHQSAYFRQPNRDRRIGGLYFAGGGTHPGAGVPGVLLGAEVTAGLVARDRGLRPVGARRRRCGDGRRPPRGAARAPAARGGADDDEPRRAHVRARLPAAPAAAPPGRLPALPRVPLARRPGRRRPARRPPRGWPRSTRGRRGGTGERTREVEVLEDLATRHPLPRAALADFCEGMRWDLAGRAFCSERELDAYCYRVAGTVGIVMASVLGTEDDERARPAAAALGMAMQRTNILRDLDEDGAAGRAYLARETTDRFGAPRARRARGPAARPDRQGGRALRRGPRRRARCCATAARRCAPRRGCTARSCARSSATATARGRAGRPCGGGASSGWSPGAASRPAR